MKIERIISDSPAVSGAVSAEKIKRDEKGTVTSDAVVFDKDKNQNFQKNTREEKDEKEQAAAQEQSFQPAEGDSGKKLDVVA